MFSISQFIERTIKCASIAYMIYLLIQFIDVTNHSYNDQYEKITSAEMAFNRTCNDINLLAWPGIIDNCVHYRKISQRSIIWETIVEVSNQLHPCHTSKQYHDEHDSIGGHVHSSEKGNNECSFVYILGFGIAIGALLIIGVINRQKNIDEKIKHE